MKKIKISFILLLLSCAVLQAQPWQYLGPVNRTGKPGWTAWQGSGMVNSIAFHPKYNTADASIGGAINKTIFIGSAFGGLWISRDAGTTWNTSDPLGQYTNLSTDGFLYGCGVIKILVDPVTPTTLYAALSAPVSMPLSFSTLPMTNYYPVTGIYKYTPATGWVLKRSYPYMANNCVLELKFDPTNPSILFACMDDGVYRSTDAANTWIGPLVTEGAGKPFRNLVFDPANALNVYACGREVYKSTDGGASFSAISNFGPMLPGLTGNIILTNIAILSSTAIYARVHYDTGGRMERIFRYNGSTWTALSTPIFPIARAEYHYDRMPMLAKKVGTTEYLFAGSEVLNLWNSSTSAWTSEGYNDNMHADLHDIAFSPDGGVFMAAHDGGVSLLTTDFYTLPNTNWVTCNTNLNISTVVSFSGSQKNPNLIIAGEHDNGNSIIKNATAPTPTWAGYDAGDGGDKMTSLFDANEWYDREIQGGGSRVRRVNSGNETDYGTTVFSNTSPITSIPEHTPFEEFGDKKPMVMDPNNPNIVYKGSNILLRSLDKGATSQILFRKSDCYEKTNYDLHSHTNCIAIAPTNSNYLYMNFINPYWWEPSFANHIYKTTNALTSTYAVPCNHTMASEGVNCGIWSEITPNFGFSNKKSVINAIVVSDKDPNVIWAGFNCNTDITPNANRKNYLVWKYNGSTWTNWGQGLPDDVSVTSLVYEKGSNDGVYAGTDNSGVFYRNASMGSWVAYGSNMPHVLIHQMEINYTENTLRIGTYGRGIWKCSLYCPSGPYNPGTCNECNGLTSFWEGTNVTIQNTTLTTYKQYVRARDYIDILPNTTITASATAFYDLYIHGCGPNQYNSYRGPKETDSDDDLVIDFGEDTDEKEEAPLSVFPNPNNGVFTLNTGNSEEKDIYVYDILGKIVYQKNKTSEKTLSIDITHAPKGIFLVKVIHDDKTETVKIINQ